MSPGSRERVRVRAGRGKLGALVGEKRGRDGGRFGLVGGADALVVLDLPNFQHTCRGLTEYLGHPTLSKKMSKPSRTYTPLCVARSERSMLEDLSLFVEREGFAPSEKIQSNDSLNVLVQGVASRGGIILTQFARDDKPRSLLLLTFG